jgi:hypothetical protein
MGTLVASTALVGFFLVWVISVMPQPSPGTLEVLVAGLLLLTMTTGASLAWLTYLSARHRLFRWDKP